MARVYPREAEPWSGTASPGESEDPRENHERKHEPVERQVDGHRRSELDGAERDEPDDRHEAGQHPGQQPGGVRPVVIAFRFRSCFRTRRVARQVVASQPQEHQQHAAAKGEADEEGEHGDRLRSTGIHHVSARIAHLPDHEYLVIRQLLGRRQAAHVLAQRRHRGIREALCLVAGRRAGVYVDDRCRRPRLGLDRVGEFGAADLGGPLLASGLQESVRHRRGCAGRASHRTGRQPHARRHAVENLRAGHHPSQQLRVLDQRLQVLVQRSPLHHRRRRRIDLHVGLGSRHAHRARSQLRWQQAERARRETCGDEADQGAHSEGADQRPPVC